MFKIVEIIMHQGLGICEIKEIVKRQLSKTEFREYYVLKPVYSNEKTTVFVPTDYDSSKIRIRYPLSREELTEIINSVSFKNKLWIDDHSLRQEQFNKIIRSGKHTEIIQLIVELHKNEEERIDNGKKPRMSDTKLLKDAEKFINEEYAYVFDLEITDTPNFIKSNLKTAL